MSAPRPEDVVSFTFAGREYVERIYEQDGCLYATTDRPRWGDGPLDVLVRHADGSLNTNISGLRVVRA